jgi:primary-amine oxidase
VSARHPLSPLSAAEVEAARDAVAAIGGLPEGSVVAQIVLDEPTKDALAAWHEGDPVPRAARALVVPGPELTMHEYTVDLVGRSVVADETIEGMRPALLFGESFMAICACIEHPDYLAALARRGIDQLDLVQIDPWPAGAFGYEVEAGRRIARCISFLRESPDDNGYARPIEGLIVHVDLGRGEVLEVIDHGIVPLPPTHGRYGSADHQPSRHLAPIEITQPEGPGFRLDGDLLTWHRWQVRIGFDPSEGVVLHQLGWDDGEQVRSVAHRLSVSEMVVPYGDPGEIQGWKNAFDAGEWGLGRMTQPLSLGCDCLGDITYVDAVMANEQGDPWIVENAICLHEEDAGILWKHVDLLSGTTEVRRHRRMVINHIATVGNYEYAFSWHLYVDGQVGLEVRLTGILSTQAVGDGDELPHGKLIAPGLAAPLHQHLFCVRLDLDVDGPDNLVHEIEVERLPEGPDNPWGNGFRQVARPYDHEGIGGRDIEPGLSRAWKVSNPAVRNGIDQPVAYKLVPTMSTPTLLANPSSPVGRRATFATHNLWVTRYDPAQRRAAGDFPNQHAGGAGLPEFIAGDRDLAGGGAGTDVVLWYTFGVTHVPRPEDWPVMPVEWSGFLLSPVGFFDRNPTLELAPPGHCHP